jgi:hypothetical protein
MHPRTSSSQKQVDAVRRPASRRRPWRKYQVGSDRDMRRRFPRSPVRSCARAEQARPRHGPAYSRGFAPSVPPGAMVEVIEDCAWFVPADRAVNRAVGMTLTLKKYRPGQSEPILVGGNNLLKPALRLMSDYRLRIEEIKGSEMITCYTRWLESVQTRDAETQEVYLTFSPHFERIWLESKKRLQNYVSRRPANIGLRSFEVSTRSGFTVGRKSI